MPSGMLSNLCPIHLPESGSQSSWQKDTVDLKLPLHTILWEPIHESKWHRDQGRATAGHIRSETHW